MWVNPGLLFSPMECNLQYHIHYADCRCFSCTLLLRCFLTARHSNHYNRYVMPVIMDYPYPHPLPPVECFEDPLKDSGGPPPRVGSYVVTTGNLRSRCRSRKANDNRHAIHNTNALVSSTGHLMVIPEEVEPPELT